MNITSETTYGHTTALTLYSRDVHIQCMPDLPTGIQLRLVGGTAWNGRYASGRVDVFKDGQWGTVRQRGLGV